MNCRQDLEKRAGEIVTEELLEFSVEEIMPGEERILEGGGMPAASRSAEKIRPLVEEATRLAAALVRPTGLMEELTIEEFRPIFTGEGENHPDAPLAAIYPKADRLALFAVTLGAEVSAHVETCFKRNNFALGTILDTAASLAADRASEAAAERFSRRLRKEGTGRAETVVLSYSPGYCGWHMSGQKKLFERLGPERIGVTLNESFLMTPLKSVTGVLVAGPAEIHLFEDDFPFCGDCRNRSCRERMEKISREGRQKWTF